MHQSLAIYRKANILKICLYGFISGMSLLLSGNTLNFWLASFNIDTKIIGFFSCVALPYVFKYFIAVFLDRYQIPVLSKIFGLHKVWLVFSQIMLIITLLLISMLNPLYNLGSIAIIAFFIALFAVMQDIILNGNRILLLTEEEQGPGTAMYNASYRLGMLFTGAGVIFASTYIAWSQIYLILAVIYAILMIMILYCYVEPREVIKKSWGEEDKSLLYNIFINPVKYFSGYSNFIWIILFIILYLLSDNMLMVMLNPFLLKHGYNAAEIASVSKFFGTIMVIIGGAISGSLIGKIGSRKSLLIFGFFHMIGHPFFIVLTIFSKNIILLYLITGYETLTGGMVTTAYIFFISKLSNGKHATTVYALLSSAMGLSRVLFPAISGIIVSDYGWANFFVIITFISMLTLIFTWAIPNKIYRIAEGGSHAA